MPYISYTQEQKRRANAIDLSELLLQHGEGLLRAGSEWRLSGNHSVTIRGNEWFDHATQRGGRAVSFVQYYYGMTYQESMCYLLNGENGEGYLRWLDRAFSYNIQGAASYKGNDLRQLFIQSGKAH